MDSKIRFTLPDDNNIRLSNLCGAMDNNILLLERALSVTIKRRGETFEVDGAEADLAKGVIEHFFAKASKNIDMNDIRQYLTNQHINPPEVRATGATTAGDGDYKKMSESEGEGGVYVIEPTANNRHFKARTPSQQIFMNKIQAHSITLCIGPAGTGKTHVAIAAALKLIHANRQYRLLLSRPVIEAAGERLGFLPGDMEKKINPYLRPLYDVLAQTIGVRELERRMGEGNIEILPLAFMRGITLRNAFLILDEAQNTTREQMKMLLSRIGDNSTIVICGDPSQNDLNKDTVSGLCDAINRLDGIAQIATHRFDKNDIVRHPLVRKILSAYEKS